MWAEGKQEYNKLVWINQRKRTTLKDILCQDMGISMRLLYKLKSTENIYVNMEHQPLHFRPKMGDILTLIIPEESSNHDKIRMDITLLYEDEDILAVEKRPYQVVHPTKHYPEDTLLNGIEHYFMEKDIISKVRFINRLDRDTSGILLVAKNAFAHHTMTTKSTVDETSKIYLAIVKGLVILEKGTLRYPIALSADKIHRCVSEQGKEAITHYEVIHQKEEGALVKIALETGRTHQIRVHFSHMGNPILGDTLYGEEHENINRQALHCTSMIFSSPRKNNQVTVQAAFPEDMKNLWDCLK